MYTVDVILISENGDYVLRERIEKYFDLKEECIGPPNMYVNGRLHKVELKKTPLHRRLVLPNMSVPPLIIWKGT